MITRSSGIPKLMNETYDPEICRPRLNGRQTSFYVTSWNNHLDAMYLHVLFAVVSRCRKEKNGKKRIMGNFRQVQSRLSAIRFAIKVE